MRNAELVGRDAELALLGGALERLSDGHGGAIVIEGEAGVGKTRLVEHLGVLADAGGAVVRVGRASELTIGRTLGVFISALGIDASAADDQLVQLARLLSQTEPAEPLVVQPDRQFRVVEATVDLVERAAEQGPLMLVLEDLHWSDPTSVLAIRTLLHRTPFAPALLAITLRTPSGRTDLDRLVVEAGKLRHQVIHLERLEDADVARLAASLTGRTPGARLQNKLRAAGGNPLYVVELLAALEGEGAFVTDDHADVVEIADSTLPPDLRLTLLRRVGSLDTDVIDLVRVASVLGPNFRLEDLASVVGQSAVALLPLVTRARAAGVLTSLGDHLSFRHDLVREAIYEDLPAGVRTALHADVARRLRAAGAPAIVVAMHVARSAAPGDDEAIAWLVAVAREARALNPSVAVELLSRVAELLPPTHPEAVAVGLDLANTLLSSGRPDDAYSRAMAVEGSAMTPDQHWERSHLIVDSLITQARWPEVIAACTEALERLATHRAPRAELRTRLARAHAIARSLDLADAVADVDRLEPRLTSFGDDPIRLPGLWIQIEWALWHDRVDTALALTDDFERIAALHPHRWPPDTRAWNLRGRVLALDGRLNQASTLMEERLIGAEAAGDWWGVDALLSTLYRLRWYMCDWAGARLTLDRAVTLAFDHDQLYSASFYLGILAALDAYSGDLAAARANIARSRALAGPGIGPMEAEGLWSARVAVREVEGDIEQALSILDRFDGQSAGSGRPGIDQIITRARLSAAVGRLDAAKQVAARAEAWSHETGLDLAEAIADWIAGIAHSDTDRVVAGATTLAATEWRLYAAGASEDAAVALATIGRPQEAGPWLDGALSAYEAAGATFLATRALGRARAAGLRRGSRRPHRGPRIGWDSLTPAELAVIDHVAEGRSNPAIADRLFISRRTVEAHLRSVFAKLGVTSRAEVAVQATRRSMGTGA